MLKIKDPEKSKAFTRAAMYVLLAALLSLVLIMPLRGIMNAVSRFDFIAQRLDDYPNEKIRFYRFTEECDRMLAECSMGELYIQNPYECFLLICMLAEDPLGTYADVVERSYE